MNQVIILVEDDIIISKIISFKLQKQGFIVYKTHTGDSVKRMVIRHTPDCILLDIRLPKMSGYEVFNQLKKYYLGSIIFFTEQSSEKSEIIGLGLGADDFINKNQSFNILLARINRVLKQNEIKSGYIKHQKRHDVIIGSLHFNKKEMSCSFNNKNIKLSSDNLELLYFFILNKNRVITRDELYITLRGVTYDGVSRGMDIAISRLKHKLLEAGMHKDIIDSFRGKGYLFDSNLLSY